MNRPAPGILKDWVWVRTQLFDRGPANDRNRRFSPISVRADEGLLNELIAAPPETGPHLC